MSETAIQFQGPQSSGALATTDAARGVAEAQAALMISKAYPRDEQGAYNRIMRACERQSLAETACYTYARGGTAVEGPSIRLAEMLAQSWGNIQYGIRELEQRRTAQGSESVVQAFAWDTESNTRQEKVFQVRHIRDTKAGSKALTDQRDIYEIVANQGARRLRACILGIIPGDVVDDAVAKCKETLEVKVQLTPENVQKLLAALATQGVTRKMVEKFIGRVIEALTPAQAVRLKSIYNSLRDGVGTVDQFFEVDAPAQSQAERINATIAKGTGKATTDAKKEDADPKTAARVQTMDALRDGSTNPADAVAYLVGAGFTKGEADRIVEGALSGGES